MKKKNKKKVVSHIKTALIYVAFTLIISQLLTALTGFTIVDPILSKIGPRSISIEPINFPITYGERQVIRVNIVNDGLRTINDLNAKYQLKCEFDDFRKAELHSKTLKKGGEDFFEFESNLNINCSLGTEPSNIDFFVDRENQCYIRIEDKTSSLCSYCPLEIKVYEGYNEIGNLSYWYPFFEGNISLSGSVPSENSCLPYDIAENISELTILPDYNIKIYFFDFSPGCIRGDIEKEWCEEYYPELYEET